MLIKDAGRMLEENLNLVYAICRRYFVSWEEVEEARQQTAVRVLHYADQCVSSDTFTHWLRAQTRYACLDIVKQRADSVPISLLASGTPIAPLVDSGASIELEHAPLWRQLSEEEQDVLELLDSGYSQRAIYDEYGYNAWYIIKRLRKRLTDG